MPQQIRRLLAPALIGGIFLLLAVGTIAVAVHDFPKPVDDPNITGLFTPLFIWTLIFGFAAYRTLTGRLFAGHRWEKIDRQLLAAGYRRAIDREVEQTAGIPLLLLSPPVLGMDRGGGVDHVSVGSVEGREARAFRARVRGGRHWMDVPAVAVRVPAHLSRTVIRPVRRGLRPPTSLKRVPFELESFNRSIEVRSVDRFFATAMLDQRMMQWLERHLGETVIELADGWVMAWSNSLHGSPVSPLQLVDLLTDFNAHIPRATPSLFPQRATSVTWIHRRKRAGLTSWLDRFTHKPDGHGDAPVRTQRSDGR